MDDTIAQIVAGLEAQSAEDTVYQPLVNTVRGLYTDFEPADCAVNVLLLSQMPEYPEQDDNSGGASHPSAGGSFSASGSSDNKTETTENGVLVTLNDGDTVKIVDSSKTFADVAENYWSNAGIDFASSRELFNSTSGTTFSPEQNMSRAVIWTVLARLHSPMWQPISTMQMQ